MGVPEKAGLLEELVRERVAEVKGSVLAFVLPTAHTREDREALVERVKEIER